MSNVISKKKLQPSLRHGHIFSPKSRAYFAWEAGRMNAGQLNQREAGKFFPQLASGLRDPIAPDDQANALPPPDGRIASANQGDSIFLDEPGRHWQKHDVESHQLLTVSWHYTARHLTRRWNYFITRPDWNPDLPLSREQFEEKPFWQVQLSEQPFWSHGEALNPPNPTVHDVMLPERTGYHVLLAVWEVADTGNAFYQVIDLDFVGASVEPLPAAPAGLRATSVSTGTVALAWNAPSIPASSYRVYRDNVLITAVSGLTFNDEGLNAGTRYSYAVSSVNAAGQESARSQSIAIITLTNDAADLPPTPPTNLYSMGVTATSVSLMWGPSSSVNALQGYIVYRDGNEISRLPASQLSYLDTNVAPANSYRYFVAAIDVQGRLSVPGNVLTVTTLTQDNGGGDDNAEQGLRQWVRGTTWYTGERVRHNGLIWVCLQQHTSWLDAWAPGAVDGFTLWREAR